MAQTRVSEYFPSKKKSKFSNATKRRKLELTTTEETITNLSSAVSRNVRDDESGKGEHCLQSRVVVSKTKSKSGVAKAKSKPVERTSTRKTKSKNIPPNDQPKISEVFATPINEFKNAIQALTAVDDEGSSEAVPSAWDEHDGPESTPTKQLRLSPKASPTKSHKGKQEEPSEDTTPAKAPSVSSKSKSARKKLNMIKEKNVDACVVNQACDTQPVDVDKLVKSMQLPQKAVSPLPNTPEGLKTPTKSTRPKVPTSPNVKAAIEKCKQLLGDKSGNVKAREKQIKSEIRARLKKAGKLEELKSELGEVNKALKQVKVPAPKLKKFDNIEIEVEQPQSPVKASPIKSEPATAPAYERYHSLATPAPPSLSLPYKYKLLMEMFRGMDTVVSMMHNRSEMCTFSKLKAAVQMMTKRNFELNNVGQIRTVYPAAYCFRQERPPCFGKKLGDYQLTVDARLQENPGKELTKAGKPTFTATQLLQRRQTFHTGLISSVKLHHKNFLKNLDRPLSIHDSKITRWHPQFPLDKVPDILPAELPEPPNVHKFHSAKDVLEQTRGKLLPRVEQALANVAKNSPVKTEAKPNTSSEATPTVKGVPLSLLAKIRAKEAKKLEAAMMRNPEEDRKKEMMKRLPDMIRIIRSYFVTEKKPSIELGTMIQKLADSTKSCISIRDVETHVKLLLEVAPEWLTMVQIKKGKYLKIDRNIDVQGLSDKIYNQAKAMS